MSGKSANPFGRVDSIADASIFSEDELPGSAETPDIHITDEGNALWSYQREGRINGIPVVESARGLKIDNDELLSVAFELERVPKSEIFYMSPDNQEGIGKYDTILGKVYNGEAVVLEENKQYDAQKGCFLVWVRYDLLAYKLHPRFEYLTKE